MPRGARSLALHGVNRKPGVRVFLDLSILESANLLFGKKAGKELLCRGALVPSLCMAKTASPASAFFRFIHFRICESALWKESRQKAFTSRTAL